MEIRKVNTDFRGDQAAIVKTLTFQPILLTKNKDSQWRLIKISVDQDVKEQRGIDSLWNLWATVGRSDRSTLVRAAGR